MSQTVEIGLGPIEIEHLLPVLNGTCTLKLTAEAEQRVINCRQFLTDKLHDSRTLYYGINTGFGALCNVEISAGQIEELQANLVMSHACGTGEAVPREIVRLMLFLKIYSLSRGHSGIRLETIHRLLHFYNHDILPVVYEQGSLGASGDLAPLAHLSLPLIGKGEVDWQGERWAGKDLANHAEIEPITLQAKEGLALLNGTQFMSAYACWALLKSKELFQISDKTAALSLDAFNCKLEPFHHKLHELRPQNGQVTTATNIRELLEGSELREQLKEALQDPYSFRCIPQVHGASRDAFNHVQQVVETEINAVTDNPNLLPEVDLVLSGGNFHGQPLALTLDYLTMAMAEIGNISERRTYKLLNGNRGLPPFLIQNPGLNSGLMIPQYTAASLVSQNKQLCTPSSVDSITSSNGQEDHVSMGANSATKCYKVIDNLFTILAIEWLVANQALDFRRPKRTSPPLEKAVAKFRESVPFNDQDRVMYEDMRATVSFLASESDN